MSIRVVPSATEERICVSPRVNSAEPCTRGATSTSVSIGRISSWARPSGRFLSIAIRRRMMSFSSVAKARVTSGAFSGSTSPSAAPAASSASASSSTASIASWRASFSGTCVASSSLAPQVLRIFSSTTSSTSGLSTSSFSLPAVLRSSSIVPTRVLISEWAMSRASSTSASLTPLAPHSTIRIASSVAGDDQVHLELLERLLLGVDDEVAVELADPHGADVLRDRDRRDRQRRGGAVHRQDVVGVDVVDRQRLGDQLRLEVPALGEQGPDRTVDHPRGQGRLLTRSRLAAEERAGDLAGRVVLLLDVHRQREEVDITKVAHRRGAEDHRVPGAHDDRSARLPGELAGFEGDLLAADLSRNAAHIKHAHVFAFPFDRPDGGQFPQNSRSRTAAMLAIG